MVAMDRLRILGAVVQKGSCNMLRWLLGLFGSSSAEEDTVVWGT